MSGPGTDVVVADHGPVADAALILARCSTLSRHVAVLEGDYVVRVDLTHEIPFDQWGSGTQAMWRLLCAIAYSRFEVSLYEVVSRLDTNNQRAAGLALAALCGERR